MLQLKCIKKIVLPLFVLDVSIVVVGSNCLVVLAVKDTWDDETTICRTNKNEKMNLVIHHWTCKFMGD